MDNIQIVYIISAMIWGVVWGMVTNKIIENKGYNENWFWWGFFFSWIAAIVAATKPQINESYYSGERTRDGETNRTLISKNTDFYISSDCPLVMTNYCLEKDNNSNISIRCSFTNTRLEVIKAMIIDFECFGIDDEKMESVKNYTYLDLNIHRYERFGIENRVAIPDSRSRKFKFTIKKILFDDDSWWLNSLGNSLEKTEIDVHSIDSLGILADQYSYELANITPNYGMHSFLYKPMESIAICGCGTIVAIDDENCPRCGVSIPELKTISDISYLAKIAENYDKETESKKIRKMLVSGKFAPSTVLRSLFRGIPK